ncbi:CT620/CT621 family type III secretion system effector [Chlamydia crocodili]|uniref:CT620/CT621 family type III secretion system effector n=1 Tax=Chlamydia TaxID=810 RepID=UPI002FC72508
MDIINSYSVSANYKKLPITPCSESIQKRHQLLESIFHYERTEAERHIVQRLLCILDQQSDEKYRQLIEKLRKSEIEDRVVSKKSHTVAVHHKPLSDLHSPIAVVATTSSVGVSDSPRTEDPFYNATKQQWAHNLLKGIQEVVNKIVQAANGQSSSADAQALQKIQTEVNRLVDAGVNLTNKDFESLYALPTLIFTTVQRSTIFTGGQKTDFINQLAEKYGNANQLAQVFADGRVEGLKDVLDVVKTKLTEEEFSIFLEIQEELGQLQSSVKTYDKEKFDRIDAVGDQLADTISISALSRNDKIDLCSQISYLYKDQVSAVESFNTVIEATIFVNRHQEAIFAQVSSLVASLMGVFAPIDLGKVTSEISSAAIAGALQTVRAINSRFNDLTAEQQTLVNDAVKAISTFKGEEYIAAVWAYFVASTVLADKPTANLSEVGSAVAEAAKEIENTASFTLAVSIRSTMNKIQTASGTFIPTNNNSETYTIYSQSNGKVSINASLLNRGNIGFLPNITSAANRNAESTARAYFTFKGLAEVETAKLQSKVEETQNQHKAFQDLKTELYKDQLFAQANELQTMALPSAVASVLIDRYMPKEVDFLNGIYAQLYYSNLGSSVGNALIDAISEYVNAATYFNFASYVGQQPAVGEKAKDVFPGTADSARNKLETERQKAAAYLKSTQNAETVLEEQVKKVTEDSKITNEQRTRIIDSLNNYRDNLNAISGSLVLLQNYLAPLSIDNGTVDGTFTVKGGEEQWQARLEILEDALVSGLSGNAINGGMFPLQATIQSDQQSFADMGQNYQLELQMHLTSMQQEWTVVATSLQVLNQMYLSLARSLMG